MKIHRPLAEAVVLALQEIFGENRKADKVIQTVLRSNSKWGSRDRGFIAETTYEIVRWWRLLHFVNGTEIIDHRSKTLWQILGIYLIKSEIELPEFKEFTALHYPAIIDRFSNSGQNLAVRESIPDWLDDLGKSQLDNQWEKELHAMNKQASVGLRVNTSKITINQLQQQLQAEGVETSTVDAVDQALYLNKRSNIFQTKAFQSGLFEVQDPGSQLIAPFLDVEPGMRVVDACAGAGGKSLHLSNLMDNKGRIISMDVEGWKLVELKRRAKRNGAHNIETREITGKVIKRLRESADRLLLDVPCSGLGTFRRNPDAKWKLSREFIDRVAGMQSEILQSYASIVRKGGKMVYATCSILPMENRDQVENFLTKNPDYTLEKDNIILPSERGFDGFYMALIKRNS